jgi:hypothetical protein
LSADQNSSVLLPTGVSAPRPVMTTRRSLHSLAYELSLMYWIASPTVTIFSASSSGIWMSKCSSRGHDELDRIEGVGAQVLDELRVRVDVFLVDPELFDDDLLHLLLD